MHVEIQYTCQAAAENKKPLTKSCWTQAKTFPRNVSVEQRVYNRADVKTCHFAIQHNGGVYNMIPYLLTQQ